MAEESEPKKIVEDAPKPSAYAARFLSGAVVDIVDPVSEKKKEIEANKKTNILTPEQKAERDRRTLFMGNVPAKLTNKDIKRLCKEFGEIESVRFRSLEFEEDLKVPKKIAVLKKSYDAESTCNVYVVYKTEEACDAAIVGLKDKVIEGHHIRTDKASNGSKVDKDTNARTVFIGQLKPTVTEDSLRALFEKCGTIDHVKIPRDRETGKSRHVAYVTFEDERAVGLALKFNKAIFEEREITVEKSNPNKAKKDKKIQEKKAEQKREAKMRAKGIPVKPKKDDKKKDDKKKGGRESFEGMSAKPGKDANKQLKKYLKMKKEIGHRKKK